MGASAVQLAKRALVTLIKAFAIQYQIVVSVSREATDKEVTSAFKKVALKAHPDKGGSADDSRQTHQQDIRC